MKDGAGQHPPKTAVLSLAQLLVDQPAAPPPGWIEPGLLPPQGILFVGGEPKVGKSLLVANLALALAAGQDRVGFTVPAPRRVLICQFELPIPPFVSRLVAMRAQIGTNADQNLLVDTCAAGHLLSAPQGLNHFLVAAREACAEVIVLDPLYSTHDQDENDTRSMAALCQSLLRLRDASKAALIVVHHVRKSIGRDEIGRAFRGSSALHAVGDSYLLLTRPSANLSAVELRFQFRYAAPLAPRLLELEPQSLWFSAAGAAPSHARARRKVEPEDVTQALAGIGRQARHNQLRDQIMEPPNAPSVPRNWRFGMPACKAALCSTTASTGCRCKPRQSGRSSVRSGSRPSGCPGPMRRSWLRKNRPPPLPGSQHQGPGGLFLLGDWYRSRATRSSGSQTPKKTPAFFWKVSERRPWATKREDRPAAFAGRFRMASFLQTRIPIVPTHASILSRALHAGDRESDKSAGKYRESFEGEERGALQCRT